MSAPLTTETILIEFAKAVKAAGFYPPGHPILEAVIEKTFYLLNDAIEEKGNIQWIIERTGFKEEKITIGRGNKLLELLAKYLFLKRIREIVFTQDATLQEWKDFFSIIRMDADSFKMAGGLEKLFVIKEIKGIQLNEMKYEDMRKRVIELEEKKKEAEAGKEEHKEELESKEEMLEEDAEKEILHSMEEQLEAVQEKEESLENLLDRLEKEETAGGYRTIAYKIVNNVKPFYEEKNWEDIFPALIAFAAHSDPAGARLSEQKTIASDSLKKLLHADMTGYLIARLCSHDDAGRAEIKQMLLTLGDEAMQHLLTALVERNDAYSRRQIFNALIMFGEAVRLGAEKRLDDERWFVVRQMVSLLGEIGSPLSFEAVKAAYSHKDIRVKKEVLKVIAKIPSHERAAFLLEKLNENNDALQLQAVIALGVLKDQAALEPLGKLAFKRDFWGDNTEIRKEAVRSISMIGGDRPKAILQSLLKKRIFWKKKQNDEVRCAAAIALGKIGGKDVLSILEDVAGTSTGIVHIACRKAIEGIK